MHSASYRYSSNLSRGSRRRRAIALFLAVLVHVLLIIMLLRQAPPPSRLLEPEPRPVTFQLSPEPQSTSKRASAAPKAKKVDKASPRLPEPPVLPAAPPIPPLPFLTLSKEEFAAADIAKQPSHPGEQMGGDSPDADGKNSGSAYGPGEGLGGERLYEADWYRRPTNAELSFYMPANAPSTGWGLKIGRAHV